MNAEVTRPDPHAANASSELRRAETLAPAEHKLGVIWVAMLASVVVYLGLALTVAPAWSLSIDGELKGWILVFLAMTAGLHVLVTLLLRQLLAALTRGSYVAYCVLRWALMEAIAVYGLVLAFLGVGIGITSIFFAVSVLLLGASRAGATDRAVFVSQFR